jgi:hypothetical protein
VLLSDKEYIGCYDNFDDARSAMIDELIFNISYYFNEDDINKMLRDGGYNMNAGRLFEHAQIYGSYQATHYHEHTGLILAIRKVLTNEIGLDMRYCDYRRIIHNNCLIITKDRISRRNNLKL